MCVGAEFELNKTINQMFCFNKWNFLRKNNIVREGTLVDHDFAENREKETSFAVGHGRSAYVEVAAANIVLALNVNSWLKDGLVGSPHYATNRFRQQIDSLQSRLVGHVDAQLVQTRLVIAISGCFILSFALPCDDDDTIDAVLATKIHHPDGMFNKIIVQNGASMQRVIHVAVDGQRGTAVFPVLPQVPLVIEPRTAMVSHVLDTSRQGIDTEESRSAVVTWFHRTTEKSSPQCDAVMPCDRVQSYVTRSERMVQIVPSFRILIHVATKDLLKLPPEAFSSTRKRTSKH